MSPAENRLTRILQIVLFLFVLLLFYIGNRVRHSRSALTLPPNSTHLSPMPITMAVPMQPTAPSLPVPRLPPSHSIAGVSKAPPRKPVRIVPISPALPVEPPVATTPNPPYVPVISPPPEPQEWKGQDTSIRHDGQIVVRAEEAWGRFWVEHHPGDFAPDVDFTRNMVVGVFVGSRPADQFSVSIVDVKMQSNAIVVTYRERNPPTGTFSVGVSVYPYVIKVVPKSALKVKFIKLLPEQP